MRRKVRALALSMVIATVIPLTAAGTAEAAPTGYSITGIDVSKWQGTVDWAQVKGAGVDFAYAKATEGTTYVDSYFSQNLAGAKANGIPIGGYHFARPDKGDPRGQADHLIDVGNYATSSSGQLPPMLDIEWPYFDTVNDCYNLTTTQMVDWISQFVDQIRVRTGRPTMIYTNPNWWNPCTGSTTKFGDEPLFIAKYSDTPPSVLPSGWSKWTMWQYTSTGTVPGVSGNVDQDVFNGTAADLEALIKLRPPSIPTDPSECYQQDPRQVVCPTPTS